MFFDGEDRASLLSSLFALVSWRPLSPVGGSPAPAGSGGVPGPSYTQRKPTETFSRPQVFNNAGFLLKPKITIQKFNRVLVKKDQKDQNVQYVQNIQMDNWKRYHYC